ncbi:MAG: hypothetical protein ACYCO0_05075 [Candidatus Micrarchaeaceae archaeon]
MAVGMSPTFSNQQSAAPALQIFVSHSSLDSIIKQIVSQIQTPEIYPYFAESQPAEPMALHEKLIVAISNSKIAFVFITKNVIENKDTRDIILWELGVLHSYKIPTYVFTEEGIEVPKPARFRSVSYNFRISDIPSLMSISGQVRDIATKISAEIKAKETKDRNDAIGWGVAGLFVLGLGAWALSDRG